MRMGLLHLLCLGLVLMVSSVPVETPLSVDTPNSLLGDSSMSSDSLKKSQQGMIAAEGLVLNKKPAEITTKGNNTKQEHVETVSPTMPSLPQAVTSLAQNNPVEYEVQRNFITASQPKDKNAITLTLQCDMSYRIERAGVLAKQWNGPISLAVLVEEGKYDKDSVAVKQYFDNKAPAEATKWVDVHLVKLKKERGEYPINSMRNAAMHDVGTDWLYVLDIDEDVVFDMGSHLRAVNQALVETSAKDIPDSDVVFVSPSFQWSSKRYDLMPKSKVELITLMEKGAVEWKHQGIRSYDHKDVSFSEWKDLQSSKMVEFRDGFEPYYIAPASKVPAFDEGFIGWGNDKRSQCFQMASEGFQYVVLSSVFNFSDETRSEYETSRGKRMNSPANMNQDHSNDFWTHVGRSKGCDECGVMTCVAKCPKLVRQMKK